MEEDVRVCTVTVVVSLSLSPTLLLSPTLFLSPTLCGTSLVQFIVFVNAYVNAYARVNQCHWSCIDEIAHPCGRGVWHCQ